MRGLLNQFTPGPLSQDSSSYLLSCPNSRPSHPSPCTSAGSSLLHTMSFSLAPLGYSPHFAQTPVSLAEPSPPTRTFALSQPLFRLLSLLVNIDLHIRLNIDIGAGSPIPTKASNPETATWRPCGFGSPFFPPKPGERRFRKVEENVLICRADPGRTGASQQPHSSRSERLCDMPKDRAGFRVTSSFPLPTSFPLPHPEGKEREAAGAYVENPR